MCAVVPESVHYWTNFVFGPLPGWWLSTDTHASRACLMVEGWETVFIYYGLSGNDLVLIDYENKQYHSYNIIVSTDIVKEQSFGDLTPVVVVPDTTTGGPKKILQWTLEMSCFILDSHVVRFEVFRKSHYPRASLANYTYSWWNCKTLLSQLTAHSITTLRKVCAIAFTIIWLRNSEIAEYFMVDGLSRVLRIEIPSSNSYIWPCRSRMQRGGE